MYTVDNLLLVHIEICPPNKPVQGVDTVPHYNLTKVIVILKYDTVNMSIGHRIFFYLINAELLYVKDYFFCRSSSVGRIRY